MTVQLKYQRELEKLKIPHERSRAGEHVTMSIGFFTQVPSRDETVEDIIRKADEALYRAKSEGRARWVMYGQ